MMRSVRAQFVLLLALAAFAAVFAAERPARCAAAAADYFINITGAPGTSRDVYHASWIEVASFSLGTTPKVGAGGAGAVADGKTTFDEVNVTVAGPDAATLKTFLVKDKRLPTVTIDARKVGKSEETFLEIVFTDALVTKVTPTATGVTFAFAYTKVQFLFKTPKIGGSTNTPVPGGYDLKKNEKL